MLALRKACPVLFCSAPRASACQKPQPDRFCVPENASSCGSLSPPQTPPKKSKKTNKPKTPRNYPAGGSDPATFAQPKNERRKRKKIRQTRLHASLERLTNSKNKKKTKNEQKSLIRKPKKTGFASANNG
jgi:hypothetical protein